MKVFGIGFKENAEQASSLWNAMLFLDYGQGRSLFIERAKKSGPTFFWGG